MSAPSGVVTFLFTDIEGSTRRWESDADAMRSALAAHDEVLRDGDRGARWLVFKHTGDGVCAAFASPRSAVDAAVDAQRELQLPVRMGIATGEAELRDGDYFGPVLNRAARVMAAGHGGQILVGGSTAGLLGGVDLVDLGLRRLRDIAEAGRGVSGASGRGCAPISAAADSRPDSGNLRRADTSFIGRDAEVAELDCAASGSRDWSHSSASAASARPDSRVEVAAQLADEFPDGVWVFELAAVSDPAVVPDAVAAVLGITQQPGRP